MFGSDKLVGPWGLWSSGHSRRHAAARQLAFARLRDLDVAMSRAPLPNHSLIGTGVRGEREDPGEFRTSQNWIGPRGGSLADAAFVPPPISELDRLLGNFETFAREPGGCSLPSCWSTKAYSTARCST